MSQAYLDRVIAAQPPGKPLDTRLIISPSNVDIEVTVAVSAINGGFGPTALLPPLHVPTPIMTTTTTKPDPVIGNYYNWGEKTLPETIGKIGDQSSTYVLRNDHSEVVNGYLTGNMMRVDSWPTSATVNDGYLFWTNFSLWSKKQFDIAQVKTDIFAKRSWECLGKQCQTVLENNKVFAINESNSRTELVAQFPLSWNAAQWGGLSAIVAPDGKTIYWGNNTVWTRASGTP